VSYHVIVDRIEARDAEALGAGAQRVGSPGTQGCASVKKKAAIEAQSVSGAG
jgi:hypothetical protein